MINNYATEILGVVAYCRVPGGGVSNEPPLGPLSRDETRCGFSLTVEKNNVSLQPVTYDIHTG